MSRLPRYGRFAAVPSVGELELFFRLTSQARESVGSKRRPATRLGWAVQWGTVRMLGTFLTEDPTAVPGPVVEFVAEQLGVDPGCFAEYGLPVASSANQRLGAAVGGCVPVILGG